MENPISSPKEIRWADAGPVWRERIFWMAAGMLVLWFSAVIINDFEQIAFCFVPARQRFYFSGFFIGWPLLLVGFLATKGYLNRHLDFWFFQSRSRLIVLWLLLSVLGSCYSLVIHDDGRFHFAGWVAARQDFFPHWLNYLKASAVPLLLLLWLLPTRQHPTRADELNTGSHFDLSAALESWRNELAAQLQLTADDRRELERHLADSMAELRRQGLGEEESFRRACDKIGSLRQLANEFEKANPSKAWRERIFWAAVGIIVFWQVSLVISYVVIALLELSLYFIPSLARFYVGEWWRLFSQLLLVLMAILIIKGQMRRVPIVAWFFQSRIRLAALLVFLAILCGWGQMMVIYVMRVQGHQPWMDWGAWVWRDSFRYLEFGPAPLILAVWFLPKRYQKRSRKMARPVSD